MEQMDDQTAERVSATRRSPRFRMSVNPPRGELLRGRHGQSEGGFNIANRATKKNNVETTKITTLIVR